MTRENFNKTLQREKSKVNLEDEMQSTLEILPYFSEERVSFGEEDGSLLRQAEPKFKGVYVNGSVEGTEVLFTIYTGASVSVLSERIWNQLIKRRNQQWECSQKQVFGPNGKPLKTLGSVKLALQVGPVKLNEYIAVADICDDCLLGADILLGLQEGPFDLLLSEGELRWNGWVIPCINVGSPKIRKVKCVEEIKIPEFSEMKSGVEIEHSNQEQTNQLIVEPEARFMEKNCVAEAPSLVELSNPHSHKVKVLNPYSTEVVVHKGELLGFGFPISAFRDFSTERNIENCFVKLYMVMCHIFVTLSDLFCSTINRGFDLPEKILTNFYKSKKTSTIQVMPDDGRLWPKLCNKLSRGSHIISRISGVIKSMKLGLRPEGNSTVGCSPAIRHYWKFFNSLEYIDGLLYKRFHKVDCTDSFLQLIISQQLRDEVLKRMHVCILSGHLGRKKSNKSSTGST